MIKQKLNHLDHIEDLILGGEKSTLRALQFISRMISADENLLTNIKIDGAPSLVVGTIPPGESNAGEFFVGTKSALLTNGKRYTNKNADAIVRDNSLGLASKLTTALKYLSELGLDKVYQGDLLFTDDVKQIDVGDTSHYAFKPNVITYAVPTDSGVGRAISNAKVGIILHTVYEGNTFADMHATYNPDFSNLKHSDNVFWKSNKIRINEQLRLTQVDIAQIKEHLIKAKYALSQIDSSLYVMLATESKIGELIKVYHNLIIREGHAYPDPIHRVIDLITYVLRRFDIEAQKLKTTVGQNRMRDRGNVYANTIEQLRDEFIKLFVAFDEITAIKLIILRKLLPLHGLASFYQEGNDYRRTAGEGLVVACSKTNDIVKLVDRFDFSRINFQQPKDWN